MNIKLDFMPENKNNTIFWSFPVPGACVVYDITNNLSVVQ